MPDETLCAILWEYKDRGQKGYDLTERLFTIIREKFPQLTVSYHRQSRWLDMPAQSG
jgi:hypothetical protein